MNSSKPIFTLWKEWDLVIKLQIPNYCTKLNATYILKIIMLF